MESNGFITDYIRYTEPQESPYIFHLWTAIGVIASALGRKVWIDRGYYLLYPNLYILLVSPSGVGKKSTALSIGMKLIEEAGIEINVLRGKITPAKIISRLNSATLASPRGDAELLIFSREFKVFTKGIITDSSLIEDLTDLYDCSQFDYETKGEGTFSIKRPCINLLAASTPEWLTGSRSGETLAAGFGARIIPVAIAKEEKIISWPVVTPIEKELKDRLISDLHRIHRLEGEFKVTDGAKALFDDWYRIRHNERNPDNRLDGYYSKKHDMVLKVAMCVAVSESNNLVLDTYHISTALKLMRAIEKDMIIAYTGAAIGERPRNTDRVYFKIREREEISHTELIRSMHWCITAKELREAIETLIEEDVIERFIYPGAGRPRIIYRIKEKKGEEK